MTQIEKEFYVDKINNVINSKTSTLSSMDVENLVVLREKIKNYKEEDGKGGKPNLIEIIKTFWKFFKDN